MIAPEDVTEALISSPKALLIYRLVEYVPPEVLKDWLKDAAGEHVAMLVPCEAVALIKALDLESV